MTDTAHPRDAGRPMSDSADRVLLIDGEPWFVAGDASDYLEEAERIIEGPQFKNGSEYLQDYLLLGIGQQLRRIADALVAETHSAVPDPEYVPPEGTP